MSGAVVPPFRINGINDVFKTTQLKASHPRSDQLDNGNKTPTTVCTSILDSEFSSYENRLKTFTDFPNKHVSKESLAKAGFYYTGSNDIVRCAVCGIEGYQWMAGDDPMTDHKTWNPQCRFVMSFSGSSNSRNVDTCGLYGVDILPNSLPNDEIHLENLGINKNKGPAHETKFSYESRLNTFNAWPKCIKQTPHDLAEAGFFYVGIGDQTICFHCGGGLKDWEENDDPWEEHALWFPKCSYLFLKKGQDYITAVKEKRDPRVALPSTSSSSSETKETPKPKNGVKTKKVDDVTSDPDLKTLCKICLQQEVGVVFLPCGHIVSCVECSSALKNCPVCRKPLEATARAFLS